MNKFQRILSLRRSLVAIERMAMLATTEARFEQLEKHALYLRRVIESLENT